jgi:glucokinase
MEMVAIGIDVGGTKIAAGLVALGSGQVLSRRVTATEAERGGEAVLRDVLELAKELLVQAQSNQQPVCGIGLDVCELVDLQGNVTSDFTVAWKGLPVRQRLGEIAPSVVESDVRAQALAEARFGSGKNFDPFVFVNIGTGISSCLVQGGVPLAGARGNALVLGTGPVSVPGVPPFVLEEFASGSAVGQRYAAGSAQRARGLEAESPLSAKSATAEVVVTLANEGDALAREILQSAGQAMGSALGWLANVLDPEAIVIGGGLGTADGLYWEAMVRSARTHIWSDDTRRLPIVKAALGQDAGLIGAALYASSASEVNRHNA